MRGHKERAKGKQLVAAIVQAARSGNMPKTEDGKNPLAVALGRLGGLKGGPARAANMTGEERSVIARKAAQARWRRQNEQ